MYHHHPPTNPVSGSPPIHPHVYSPVVDDQYILPQHGLPYYAPQYPLSPSEYGAPMAAQFDFGYDPTVLPQFYLMPDGTSHGSKGPRRRRSGAGAEPIKHRRTRSGCFTCRARRVKCDETHPICERCQKGGRECTYPEAATNQKGGSGKKRERPASREGSSSLEEIDEEAEDDEESTTATSPDGSQLKSSKSSTLRGAPRRGSMASQERRNRSRKQSSPLDPSPTTPLEAKEPLAMSPASPDGSQHYRSPSMTAKLASDPPGWDILGHQMKFYLNYHRKMLTFHHYLMKQDDTDFFKTTLFEYAMEDKALLYAVAAFASFHYSVQFKTGVFQTFLEYYNTAVALLRESLDPGRPRSVTTVVTILQLASFEEYLGDWTSLMEHRNAAAKIITSIWTPETLASTVENRMIFNWFLHFDLIASMMAGHNIALGAEWANATRKAVCANYESNPEELNASFEYTLCTFREMAINTSMLTAKRSQSKVTIEDFLDSCQKTLKLCHQWWNDCAPAIKEGAQKVLPTVPEADDIPCPFAPAPIWTGLRWGVNFMTLDYYALVIVLEHQISLTQSADMTNSPVYEYATKICELVAGLETYKHSPQGWLLSTQAALALAALWLPDLPNYRAWLRKELAKIEQMGFIYPLAFRQRMARLWNDERILNTWVTDDSESAIGLTIRKLVDMRDTLRQNDPTRSDIRDMRSIMSELKLESKGSGVVPKDDDEPEDAQVLVRFRVEDLKGHDLTQG